MPAQKLPAPHGTVRRYRQGGCDDTRGGQHFVGERCDACKSAMREFGLTRKNGGNFPKKKRPVGSNVTALHAVGAKTSRVPSNSHSAQSRMEAELMTLEGQFPDRAFEIQCALALVENVFNPDCRSQRHQNIKEIHGIIAGVRSSASKKKSRGRLAAVQAMSRASGRTG